MKKSFNKKQKVNKGMPSAVLLSILIHAGLFLLAGMLVVFTVHKVKEPEFEAPKAVERPKMKLRKPKVKIKKTSKPKSTTRIVTRQNRASMPDIQLPEMSGMGDGLGDGVGGGFDMMPDLSELASPFGNKITTGSELKGYFYNFNRDRSGRKTIMNPDQLREILYSFMKGGWRSTALSKYYRSPEALYSSTICVPTVMSELAPQAFGMDDAEGYCWGVLYTGKLVYPEDIKFRFWGVGDKLMAVNVDGDTVLICAYRRATRERFSSVWQTSDSKDNTYFFGEHRARPSDWITLKAGEEKDIQVLLADLEGGLVYHILSVEVEGQDYPWTRAGGGPTFPVFRTGEISRDVRDVIYSNLYPGDTCLTNGPIFNDFTSTKVASPKPVAEVTPETVVDAAEEDDEPQMRTWTRIDGTTVAAEFRVMMGKSVILENAKRKQIKLPLDQFSPEDREYIELSTPPRFNIDFIAKSTQIQNPPTAPWSGGGLQRPLQMLGYVFGARVKQQSTGDYSRNLLVEYVAVGEEVDGDNYVLLDRGISSFTPTRENKKTHEFEGKQVELKRIAYRSSAPMRGTKYAGYLITITNERGEIIQHKASSEFLFENLENLKKLKPNNHFNSECIRVIPARPNEDSRGFGAVSGN